jgi:hypothetical protein
MSVASLAGWTWCTRMRWSRRPTLLVIVAIRSSGARLAGEPGQEVRADGQVEQRGGEQPGGALLEVLLRAASRFPGSSWPSIDADHQPSNSEVDGVAR